MAAVIPTPPYRIALIGAGRVGTAVAELLRGNDHEIAGVAAATSRSAAAASVRLGAPIFGGADELPACDLVLIGTPDRAIRGVAERASRQIRPGTVVIHFAGSLGTSVLRSVMEAGGLACALHPVQACPDVDTAIKRLPGSAWGVTCEPGLEEWAAGLVQTDLRGLAVQVDEDDRALWHAAAVTTSNGIAALLDFGEALLTSIGVEAPEQVLAPLAVGTVSNARHGGGGGATLTGPLVRGETDTIAGHLRGLKRRAPGLSETYVLVARSILSAATRVGRMDASTTREIVAILEDS